MIQISHSKQRSAFPWWLRTGKLPPALSSDELELKFNPWHDPADGRFTFAGSGRHHGKSESNSADRASGRARNIADRDKSRTQRLEITPKTEAPRARQLAGDGKTPEDRAPVKVQPKPIPKSRLGDRPNQAAEFVGGVGEGLYGVAEGTVSGVYATLTTNPVTTVRSVGRRIAGIIDTAIAAEDTPARIQISRAANAVTEASARDIGRTVGSVAGNTALAVAPGATLTKVSALRRARSARPRTTYDPPQIGWVKENLGRDSPAKRYNDAATGARPGQAPTLMRTMPDGSKRPVKFDGVWGDYVIDRKFGVSGKPRALAQILRQSEVLAQHRLIGTWEVPTIAQRDKAIKLLRKMNITNIKVRVVKP